MRSLKNLCLLLAVSVSFLFTSKVDSNLKDSSFLLICNGKYSKSYHKDYGSSSDYCKGLMSCRADILRLPASEAKVLRKDPCDFCYGH